MIVIAGYQGSRNTGCRDVCGRRLASIGLELITAIKESRASRKQTERCMAAMAGHYDAWVG